MRIVHYLNHGRRANGHVEVAVDLACEQARQHHDIHFISAACDFAPVLARHGVAVHDVPEPLGALRPVRMAPALMRICRSVRPDVVNAHMVAAAAAAALVRPLCGFKLVTTVHNSFDRQAVMMRVGDRVIAVSEAVRAEMQAKWVPARRLRVVRNGVIGGARRPFLPVRRAALQHPAIVTVAGLHPRKGIADLLAAFALLHTAHPDAQLYLVGDGPCRALYEEQARSAPGAGAVHFLGHLDDPREVLADADLFVLASLQEPFALVLGEARQMGCAIVATRVGGNPEALWQGAKGRLVPPGDPPSLAAALGALLADDGARQALGRAARADVADITVERMARETVDVYRELVGEGVPRRQAPSRAAPGAAEPANERDTRGTARPPVLAAAGSPPGRGEARQQERGS